MDYAAYLKQHEARHLEELKAFLRIPSISALSAHKADMVKAANWLVEQLKAAGLQRAELIETPGHPVVYAEWLGAPGAPTALIYGHYDVQPVDPEHLWETPPFEPTVRDGKIYARGASDDKGQVFQHIKALEALLATEGKLPVNVKLLIEGEEEVGSTHLDDFVLANQELLKADVLVISDTPLYAKGQPALCYGLRGLAALELTLTGAKGDLHSGLYGGAVQNPLHALVELLASLHENGRVAVKGFYDRVVELTVEERAEFAALPFDEAAYRAELGVPELFGEPGYTPTEQTWARPTLELNGVWGGFQGEGTKTVIPNQAHAKITCRLVPDQDPKEIQQLIQAHLEAHLPPGVTLSVTLQDTARPVVTAIDHPALQAAAAALAEGYGKAPYFTRMGGSVPVVETFANRLGLPAVLMGFGLPDENFHAPNEHFNLDNYEIGKRVLCSYWHKLAEVF